MSISWMCFTNFWGLVNSIFLTGFYFGFVVFEDLLVPSTFVIVAVIIWTIWKFMLKIVMTLNITSYNYLIHQMLSPIFSVWTFGKVNKPFFLSLPLEKVITTNICLKKHGRLRIQDWWNHCCNYLTQWWVEFQYDLRLLTNSVFWWSATWYIKVKRM